MEEKNPPVKNPMAEWPWKSSAPEPSGDAEAKNPDVGRDEFLRAAGRQQAWLDLMCRFDAKQRRHVANLLAHSWTLQAIEIRGHYGEEVERIEAAVSHENAVAALKEQRAARVDLREKKAVELLESITARVNAHAASAPAVPPYVHDPLLEELFNIAMYGDRGNAKNLQERIAALLLAASPQVAALAVPQGWREGYLCRAWGETDLPEAAFVHSMEDVERFIVQAQFGDWKLIAELNEHPENIAILREQMKDLRDALEDQQGSWQIKFEIGGISVERAMLAANPQA